MSVRENVVQAKKLGKSYGAVTALDDISFKIGQGEIIGFAGDNGAGKSTLMKMVAGDVTPTTGELLVNNKTENNLTTKHAQELGISMVYQDLALCDNLEIVENIFLGRELTLFELGRFKVIDKERMLARSQELLDILNLELPSLEEPVTALSGGQRQLVAIARAIAFSPKLVIMDEPTAALSVKAVQPLLEQIRRLPETGCSVMIVSHRLSDLLDTCDRIYVLRRGNITHEFISGNVSEAELLHAIASVSQESQ